MHQTDRSIVVGTDGSQTASVAVARGAELARLLSAKVHLVCAVKPPLSRHFDPVATAAMEFAMEDAHRVLKDAADHLRGMGVKVENHAIFAEAAEALLQTAEEENAVLLVVGSKGMSGAGRYLLGSVPNKVSHHAPCNVLIVRTVDGPVDA